MSKIKNLARYIENDFTRKESCFLFGCDGDKIYDSFLRKSMVGNLRDKRHALGHMIYELEGAYLAKLIQRSFQLYGNSTPVRIKIGSKVQEFSSIHDALKEYDVALRYCDESRKTIYLSIYFQLKEGKSSIEV